MHLVAIKLVAFDTSHKNQEKGGCRTRQGICSRSWEGPVLSTVGYELLLTQHNKPEAGEYEQCRC
jgi:hypothetical protein